MQETSFLSGALRTAMILAAEGKLKEASETYWRLIREAARKPEPAKEPGGDDA